MLAMRWIIELRGRHSQAHRLLQLHYIVGMICASTKSRHFFCLMNLFSSLSLLVQMNATFSIETQSKCI